MVFCYLFYFLFYIYFVVVDWNKCLVSEILIIENLELKYQLGLCNFLV
jgi:hypothetical protein